MHLFIAVDRIEIKGAKVIRGGEASTAASTQFSPQHAVPVKAAVEAHQRRRGWGRTVECGYMQNRRSISSVIVAMPRSSIGSCRDFMVSGVKKQRFHTCEAKFWAAKIRGCAASAATHGVVRFVAGEARGKSAAYKKLVVNLRASVLQRWQATRGVVQMYRQKQKICAWLFAMLDAKRRGTYAQ
jgi:hypothetical protein